MVESQDAPTGPTSAAEPPRRKRLADIARRLTFVNLSFTIASLVTSPLQARALGPAGRGDLAAVTVVGGLLVLLGDFGLSSFVVRESARGTSARRLIGSVGPILLGVGLVYCLTGFWTSQLLAGHRHVVHWLLLVVMTAMPVLMFGLVGTSIVMGTERWGVYTLQRLAMPVGSLVIYSVLYVIGDLTVTTAGLTYVALSLAATLPGLIAQRRVGKPEWSSSLARDAVRFGSRVWLTVLANQTNARLDQLLMTRLVSNSQLGLYVIAVNVSLLQNSFTAAVSSALLPRVSAGDSEVAARALRLVLALTLIFSGVLFLVTPVLIPVVFGGQFTGAVTMCQLLLLAAIPFGAVQVMTATLIGVGRPAVAARGELISVFVTVPALIAFVGRYGGNAAAVISLAAYSVTASYLSFHVRRHLRLRTRDMLVVKRTDFLALRSLPGVRRLLQLRHRGSS